MENLTKNTPEQNKPTGGGAGTTQNKTSTTGGQSGYGTSHNPAGHTGQGTTGSGAGSATQQVREQARQGAEELRHQIDRGAEMLDQAKQTVADAYERTSKSVQETYDQAMDYGRQNPGTMALIAFGAGIGVGLLLASGMGSRRRSSRFIPPVMNALSEIAVELFS